MDDAPHSSRSSAWLTVMAWGGGAATVAWILFGPYLVFAYRNGSARLVTETVILCVALLGGLLAHGRYVRARRLQDLLLAQGLVVLALSGPPFAGTVARLLPGGPGTTDVWLSVSLQLGGALLLLGAAVIGRDRTLHGVAVRRSWRLTLLVPALVLAVLLSLLTLLGDRVHLAVDTAYLVAEVRPPLLTAHPFLITAQFVSAGCFLAASLIWAVQARRREDALVRWLGPACALGGFARLVYALSPSLYTDWFYAGDVLRLGLYLLLLVGSARELSDHWTARTAGAVLEDRRRLAAELHDGVVQELTYIRGESHALDADPERRDRLLNATDRALDEARAAIHALTRLDEDRLAALLERTGHELGRRHGITVEVNADGGVDVDPDQLHTLLRIVREAVTNAARHGRARTVQIDLTDGGGTRVLRVHDDGSGFEPLVVARAASGYGLVSMAERARSLPGTLELDSEPGAGSEVRVTW